VRGFPSAPGTHKWMIRIHPTSIRYNIFNFSKTGKIVRNKERRRHKNYTEINLLLK
jgi:hypothetical protein